MSAWRAISQPKFLGVHWLFILELGAISCTPSATRPVGHSISSPAADPSNEAKAPSRSRASQDNAPPFSTPSPLPPREPKHSPQYAEIPPEGTLIGGSGGVAVEAFSPSGHWVAYCQRADAPDEDVGIDARGLSIVSVDAHFRFGEETLPIDALLSSDLSGRYAVVLQGTQALLVDAVEHLVTPLASLNPDLRGDGLPDHRSFAFSDRGLAVLSLDQRHDAYLLPLPFVTRQTRNEDSHLKSLAIPLEFGARSPYRIEAGKGFVRAITLAPGSTTNSWPTPSRAVPELRCTGAHQKYDAYSRLSSPRPEPSFETTWLALPTHLDPKRTLHGTPAPGYVMSIQGGWVRREDSGRTVFVQRGTQKQISSSRCGARFLHADPKTGLFLIACEQYRPVASSRNSGKKSKRRPKYRFDLYLIRPGFVRSLRADTARTGVDISGPSDFSFVSIRPGANAAIADFTARKLIKFDGDVFVLKTGPTGALLRRGNVLSFWRPHRETALTETFDDLSPVIHAPHAIAIGKQLFTLGEKLTVRTLPAPPLSITDSGYALIAKEAATMSRWARGPMLLSAPKPSAVDSSSQIQPIP